MSSKSLYRYEETFSVDPEPRRLVVSLTLERREGDPVTIRRVYDPVDAPK